MLLENITVPHPDSFTSYKEANDSLQHILKYFVQPTARRMLEQLWPDSVSDKIQKCETLTQLLESCSEAEAHEAILAQHAEDENELEGGVLGDKSKFTYLGLFEEEMLQDHL